MGVPKGVHLGSFGVPGTPSGGPGYPDGLGQILGSPVVIGWFSVDGVDGVPRMTHGARIVVSGIRVGAHTRERACN